MSEPTNNGRRRLRHGDAVPPGCECPKCGEACVDLLVWIDDEEVRCTSCGTTYDPMTGEVRGQGPTEGGGDGNDLSPR